MRGAWGKPYGTVARVNIGQIILSIRTKDANAAVVQEALRRARYKFPGRQKIIVSRKWGFTNVNREDYVKLKEEKRVLQCVYCHLAHNPKLTFVTRQGWCLRTIHPSSGPSGGEPARPAQGLSSLIRHVYYATGCVTLLHLPYHEPESVRDIASYSLHHLWILDDG